MDDRQNPGQPSGAPEQASRGILLDLAEAARVRARKIVVWRLGILLGAAVIAFALTVWFLLRMDLPTGPAGEELAAASVVRTQLDALNRGDLREAYDLFSQRYRDQVPFEAFHDLVATHVQMFRARKVDFESREESHARAVLDTHILSTNGERYFARYTVIRIEGHWWIDDVRWGTEPQPPSRTTAHLAQPAIPSESLPHFNRTCG